MMFYLHIWSQTKPNYKYSYAMPFEDPLIVYDQPTSNKCWADGGSLHLSTVNSSYAMQIGGDINVYSESDLSSIGTLINYKLMAANTANDTPKLNQLVLSLFTNDVVHFNETNKYIAKISLDQFK
jgi:hypothetical protein